MNRSPAFCQVAITAGCDRLLPTGPAELHTPVPAPLRAAAHAYRAAIDTLTYTTGFAA